MTRMRLAAIILSVALGLGAASAQDRRDDRPQDQPPQATPEALEKLGDALDEFARRADALLERVERGVAELRRKLKERVAAAKERLREAIEQATKPEPKPGEPGDSGANAAPIRIAVCGPMTGAAAAFGESITRAAQLAEREINAGGGITLSSGTARPVEFVIYDDMGEPGEAARVARMLAADASIVAIVGHFNSTCSLAAKPVYARAKLVAVSPGSTNAAVCKGSPYSFRNLLSDPAVAAQTARYVKQTLGIDKVAVLYDNDDYGKGLRNDFARAAAKLGLTVTESVPYFRERTADFKPLVERAVDSGAKAMFIAGLYSEGAEIVRAARTDAGFTGPIVGGDGLMTPDFIRLAGKHAEGALVTSPFMFGLPDEPAAAKRFQKQYTDRFGEEPDIWAALTYDACGALVEAIRRAGTPDRQKIRDALAGFTDAKTGYTGITGLTAFDANGDCVGKRIAVAVVKQGKFVAAEKQPKK